ncbi:M-phase phosphoprotein 6 [Harpegnathos saltator]|uniref:M-phase phosphoprotein 6 n=2 Tax=Harpegnathos saltator TaxID=610380 RepID=E2BWV6_HARSA|nr:M-phase phosphoprotein 6 [Harpegnathos saltator]
MKRTKEKVDKQQYQEEGELYFGSQVTKRMKKESERFIMESSYVFCEKLVSGRMSFQGMNPVIERYMESIQNQERINVEESKQVDISDEQMSVQWQKIRGKFESMQKHKNPRYSAVKDEPLKKKKFLKPVD